ncbi:MAG TPA: hypothetical protein VJ770_27600 [Stellaceae bacterium]|nr:hypothetical protein [Stellaceae bacterium]
MSAASSLALSADRPFPGLRPFAFADREFFFGREDQHYELYRRLDRSRFIAVVGSSGSGKSSLVRAGLHPLIAEESAENAGRVWHWLEMHPGDAPLKSLAAALAGLAPAGDDPAAEAGRRERFLYMLRQSRFGIGEIIDGLGDLGGTSILLLVDQFEELFRYAAGTDRAGGRAGEAAWRDEAIQFVRLLLHASREPGRAFHVLLTMRSDFVGDCARFDDLPEAVSASQFLVPALTRDQREAVIRGPIEKAGATIDAMLVERLLNDAGDELDQLPVLQHCLMRLWEEAQRSRPGERPHLTPQDYRAVGGIAHALSRHADEIMAGLPDDALAVEQVFRALSERDTEGRATRRALPFARLVAETGIPEEILRRVLDRFRADHCSFLVPSPAQHRALVPETRIDVGHEALLRRWDRISAEPAVEVGGEARPGGWLRQEADDGQIYRALLALLEGGRTLPLDQVEMRWNWWNERPRTEAWAERYGGHIERVRRLFDDSRDALAVDAARRETERKRQRRSFFLVTAGFVISVIFAVVAGLEWFAADRARLNAEAQTQNALAAKAVAEKEKTEAQRQRARAEKTIALMTQTEDRLLFDTVGKYMDGNGVPMNGAPLPLLRGILDLALKTAAQLAAGNEASPDLRYDQGVALGKTADLLLALGNKKGALAAARQSHAIFKALATAKPGDTNDQRELALADGRIGSALMAAKQFGPALAAYQDANAITKRLVHKDPGDPERQRDLAVTYEKIGGALMAQNHSDQALAAYHQESEIAERLIRSHPGNAEWQRILAICYERIGGALMAQNHSDQALAAYGREVEIAESRTRSDPGNAEWQRIRFYPTIQIGEIHLRRNERAPALGAFQKAGKIASLLGQITADRARAAADLDWVADDLKKLADTALSAGDATAALAAALDAAGQSREIYKASAAANPGNTNNQRQLELADDRIGTALRAQGRLDPALAAYRDSLAVAQALARKNPGNAEWQRDLELSYNNVGDVLILQKHPHRALAAYRDSLAICEATVRRDPGNTQSQRDRAHVLEKISEAELSVGDAAAALTADEERLTVRRRLFAAAQSGPAKSDLVSALGSISFMLLFNHRPQDALDRAEEALKLDLAAVWIETNRAHALLFLNRFDEAKAVYLKYKDARLGGGRLFSAAVKDDFAQFRKFGIDTADMKRIERLL